MKMPQRTEPFTWQQRSAPSWNSSRPADRGFLSSYDCADPTGSYNGEKKKPFSTSHLTNDEEFSFFPTISS